MHKGFVPLGTVIIAMIVVACSSGDDDVATSTAPASSSVAAAVGVADETGSTTVPPVDDARPITPYAVVIDVTVDSAGVDGRLEVTIDPGELDTVDPFTRFSSCSGLRASVGSYSVTAVDVEAGGGVRSVSVLTADRVDAPGIHDADIRVEFDEGEPVSAAGTVTLADDLRSGTFVAFEPTGEQVEGEFRCDGPDGIAVPIDEAGDEAGVLTAVEVVALLRLDDAARVVGLTLDPSEVEAVDARCPGVTGSDESVLVSVEGGQAIGAINEFELTADPDATMRMRVGGAMYDIDGVAVVPEPDGAAGRFSGTTADGVAVDGAYRCS